MDKYAIEVT